MMMTMVKMNPSEFLGENGLSQKIFEREGDQTLFLFFYLTTLISTNPNWKNPFLLASLFYHYRRREVEVQEE